MKCSVLSRLLTEEFLFAGCKVESISLNVEAVNTHRERPEVGSNTSARVAKPQLTNLTAGASLNIRRSWKSKKKKGKFMKKHLCWFTAHRVNYFSLVFIVILINLTHKSIISPQTNRKSKTQIKGAWTVRSFQCTGYSAVSLFAW